MPVPRARLRLGVIAWPDSIAVDASGQVAARRIDVRRSGARITHLSEDGSTEQDSTGAVTLFGASAPLVDLSTREGATTRGLCSSRS
jgi:hypothetical protein